MMPIQTAATTNSWAVPVTYTTTPAVNATGYSIAPPQTFTSIRVLKNPGRLRRLWNWLMPVLADERGGTMGSEIKVKKNVEVTHKKKITLTFEEGTARPGKDAAHRGSVELVRTLSEDAGETRTVGIKATPKEGNYVEVTIEELEAALAELKR